MQNYYTNHRQPVLATTHPSLVIGGVTFHILEQGDTVDIVDTVNSAGDDADSDPVYETLESDDDHAYACDDIYSEITMLGPPVYVHGNKAGPVSV